MGKLESRAQEKRTTRKSRVGVKFNTWRGGIAFSFLFANWKCTGRVSVRSNKQCLHDEP